MTKRHLAALAAVVLAAGGTGCGGGDDESSTPAGLTNYATGPMPSAPAVDSAAATRTLLPATADTHEVETDGNWVVWKARQINVGYFDGNAYSNLNLGLSGAVTPYAFGDCERSPIAYDGTRMAFVANDVSDAAVAAFYFGAPGSTLRKVDLPAGITIQDLSRLNVAVYGDVAGIWDTSTNKLYTVDLAAATPAFAEVAFTGTIVGPPGEGLLPISNAGALDLLDLATGTQSALVGDGNAGTAPASVRYSGGAFTWVENGIAFFYDPGVSTGSQKIATSVNAQANPVTGTNYVLWEEAGVVKQRPRTQLDMPVSPPTVVIRTISTIPVSLSQVQAGMGFIAWLAADTNGDTQLYVFDVGPTSTLAAEKVTADVGSGDGSSDGVFFAVNDLKVFFKQEFTALHSPGRVLKVYDYSTKVIGTLVAGDEYQQIAMAVASGGKGVVLTRDHSFRLLAKPAASAAAPTVITPQSQDVKTFAVAGGKVVYNALDRDLYLGNEILERIVDDYGGAEFLVEIYAHDLDAGGAPQRLTFNAAEDDAPATDGTWVTWYDENGWGYAMDLATHSAQILGDTSDEIRVSGGLAAWRDSSNYVHYADLVAGETAQIGDGSAMKCPEVGGRVIAWTRGVYNGVDGYDSVAHFYDLDAATPTDIAIPGSAPSFYNWGWKYSAPVATDGRYVTWTEYRGAWDHDGDSGAVTPTIAANVVVVHDLTTQTSSDVPAADWNQTGVGISNWDGDEGAVCNPRISNGVVAFGAIEYGVDNPATDYSPSYGTDLSDKEIFFYDLSALSPALVRVTNDADGVGLWDSRLRLGGNLAVWRAGGASSWGWDGKVPAVAKLK